MVTYGVTENGLVIKRLPVIKTEQEAALRIIFGDYINLMPTETVQQFVSSFSEREALVWELLEEIVDARNPDNATGIMLDFVCSLTGIKRLAATKTEVAVKCYGTEGTTIPQTDTVFSVDGDSTARFVTNESKIIGAGTDAIQTLVFSAIPDAGEFTVSYDDEETVAIAFGDDAADLQAALNDLAGLSAVTVTGNFNDGFEVTFTGADGEKPQELLVQVTNTLTNTSVAVTMTIAEDTPGDYPNVEVDCIAETAGATSVYAGTLTVIETPIAGLESVTNALDGDVGRNRETDPEFRIRRLNSLAFPGSANPDAMRAKLLQVTDVTSCIVFTNVEDTVSIDGLPGHSYYVVIDGGDETDIAEEIWRIAPAGIYPYGSVVETVQDSHGEDQIVRFSRPSEVPIFVEVDIDIDTTKFPDDGSLTYAVGIAAIKQNIVDYAIPKFSIADDVITDFLYIPIMDVAGILTATIRIGKAINPTTDANVDIDIDEVSTWDTTRIEVTIL